LELKSKKTEGRNALYFNMRKYQGEDIDISLVFQRGEDMNITGFNQFTSVIVYLYTDGCNVLKFKYPNQEGYQNLTLSDNVTLKGIVSGGFTKTMKPGVLFIEIKAKKGSTEMIDKKDSGIILVKDLIKSES
jgi:hypothetical protein